MTQDSIGFVGGRWALHGRAPDRRRYYVAVFDTRAEAMAPHVARGARACPSLARSPTTIRDS